MTLKTTGRALVRGNSEGPVSRGVLSNSWGGEDSGQPQGSHHRLPERKQPAGGQSLWGNSNNNSD